MPAPAKPADYLQEGMVVEHYITHATFEADGSSVREVTAIIKAQSDAGVQQLAVLRFPFSSFSETVDVDYVRVRKADGTVVVTPPYNVLDLRVVKLQDHRIPTHWRRPKIPAAVRSLIDVFDGGFRVPRRIDHQSGARRQRELREVQAHPECSH
jgi:hypothetical protein